MSVLEGHCLYLNRFCRNRQLDIFYIQCKVLCKVHVLVSLQGWM